MSYYIIRGGGGVGAGLNFEFSTHMWTQNKIENGIFGPIYVK